MKANELRIGNWVYLCYPDGKKAVEVKELSKNFVNGFGISGIEPIPINEDWLTVGLGFKKVMKKKDFTTYSSDRFGIRVSVYNAGFNILRVNNKSFESVHQLQNLYFALTGTELELKNENN
jgi:hypothetical protein